MVESEHHFLLEMEDRYSTALAIIPRRNLHALGERRLGTVKDSAHLLLLHRNGKLAFLIQVLIHTFPLAPKDK
jgi:hypothetical protein